VLSQGQNVSTSLVEQGKQTERFERVIGMGGCRLADGKLHMGHLNGCLASPKLSALDDYFFVIQDSIVDRNRSDTYFGRLTRLAGAVLALAPSGPRTYIIRQSTIQEFYSRLYFVLCELASTSLIIQKNPKIRRGDLTNITLDEAIFPVGEVCNIFSLGCDHVFMNDDNLRFVNLARRIRKKLRSRGFSSAPKRPELVTGGVPRLIGYNYQKMSKSNGNTITLGTPYSELAGEIQRLSSRSWLYKQGSAFRKAFKEGDGSIKHPEDYPIFTFHKAFVDPKALPCAIVDAAERYTPKVLKAVEGFNRKVTEYVSMDDSNLRRILKRIEDDEGAAEHLIKNNIEWYLK